jgi:plasmid maintenance system killer protein
MPVMIDHSPLATEELGYSTVGHVLSHLQKRKRLVVHVLIDGAEPDFSQLDAVRRSPLENRTIFIETTDPREMSLDILRACAAQLKTVDALKSEAAEALQQNRFSIAMEKLAGCFSIWQNAQQSLVGTAELMHIDVETLRVGDESIRQVLGEFSSQLRQIKIALQNRDFVSLSDLLLYETSDASSKWIASIEAVRRVIAERV